MTSSRRIKAIPQDFLQALHTHQLSLRALLPHLNPPISPEKSQITLESEAADQDEEQTYRPITSLFAEASYTQKYIPKHFPHLPDRHTYQATPQFPHRDDDPRSLREKAAEESRLAEQALRRLATAETAATMKQVQNNRKQPSLQEQRQQMLIETMTSIAQEQDSRMKGESDAMDIDKGSEAEGVGIRTNSLPNHLNTAVNAGAKYWRKPVRRLA